MPIGRIRCAYCSFEAVHPTEMEYHREDEHGDEIEKNSGVEIERNSLRRHKKNN
jgi:hypothetical protein